MTGIPPELVAALSPEFEILRPLGKGSMGTVYLAREPALRRLVAIKIPRPSLSAETIVRHRFEREARAAARIRHDSAASIHRIGHLPDGTPFLVLEYVDGRKLSDVLLSEGPFPPELALVLLSQLAGALAESHANGVVHRDVRPDNVFWIAPRALAVLTDFGIAGILETGTEVITRLTQPGEALGDPAYRSPEQLMGDPLTPAADIYALALVAYEVLTLQRPYPARSPAEFAVAHLREPPRSLSDLLPDAPPGLPELLMRCLAKDPGQRPTAAAVVRTLEGIAEGRERAPAPAGSMAWAIEGVPALATFLAELRRRRVYGVAFAYAGVCILVLTAANLTLPWLPLPVWTYPGLVAVALAGFPVAMMLAWMYDLTTSGIRRTASTPFGGPEYLRWLLPSVGIVLSLGIAVSIGWWVLAGR